MCVLLSSRASEAIYFTFKLAGIMADFVKIIDGNKVCQITTKFTRGVKDPIYTLGVSVQQTFLKDICSGVARTSGLSHRFVLTFIASRRQEIKSRAMYSRFAPSHEESVQMRGDREETWTECIDRWEDQDEDGCGMIANLPAQLHALISRESTGAVRVLTLTYIAIAASCHTTSGTSLEKTMRVSPSFFDRLKHLKKERWSTTQVAMGDHLVNSSFCKHETVVFALAGNMHMLEFHLEFVVAVLRDYFWICGWKDRFYRVPQLRLRPALLTYAVQSVPVNCDSPWSVHLVPLSTGWTASTQSRSTCSKAWVTAHQILGN